MLGGESSAVGDESPLSHQISRNRPKALETVDFLDNPDDGVWNVLLPVVPVYHL